MREAEMSAEPKTWREFLAEKIAVPKEKQRIAAALGVGPRTLDRWVEGAVPRSSRLLSQLLDTLPQHREQLTELIRRDPKFALFSPTPLFIDDTLKELPAHFYARILAVNATIADNLRFQTICTLILQQSLQLLDPDRLGLELVVVQCMVPGHNQKVRSLRERFGATAHSQQGISEERLVYLGADSLAGHVVTSCQFAVIQDVQNEQGFLPVRQEEQGKSLAAYPIQRSGRVAGCLLARSPHSHFFTRARQGLLRSYAHLLVLAFGQEEFYLPQDIALGVMPTLSVQRPLVSRFRGRVAQVIMEALRDDRILSSLEAEIIVQQQLEEELLQLALQHAEAGPAAYAR
jgi:hypothetical protein